MLRINQGLNDSFSPSFILLSPQRLTHRRTRIRITHRIEMAVYIRRRAHIRVPQPFLDPLHGRKNAACSCKVCEEARVLTNFFDCYIIKYGGLVPRIKAAGHRCLAVF